MIELPCVLLGIYHEGWLVGFDDPQRGLDLASPCYLPVDWVYGFTLVPYDPATGELAYGTSEYGPGFIRLADNVWASMHHHIARVLKERERAARAEANAARKKILASHGGRRIACCGRATTSANKNCSKEIEGD